MGPDEYDWLCSKVAPYLGETGSKVAVTIGLAIVIILLWTWPGLVLLAMMCGNGAA